MRKIIINYASGEKRYALIKDGAVEKIMIDQPEYQSHIGSIYLGVVTKVLPGMNAVFVDIGYEKNAYLQRNKLASFVLSNDPDKEKKSISSFVHQGEKLIVQVDKDPTGTKGPRVTGIIEFQGESMVYMPSGRYIAVSKKVDSEMERSDLRRMGESLKEEAEGIIFRTSASGLQQKELLEELGKLRMDFLELKKKAALSKKAELLTKKDSFLEMIQEDNR
ncbi:MAG: ribonuclease E/G, partial [Bacillota bacterium]|nr:ribonuclease E/G [Bacillota bacterium]